jgi:hypothetical protein
MMQQNLVSGETKLADYWLLLFKNNIGPRSLPEVAPNGGLPNTRW